MATHSSILVWKIPWMEGPGGLQSMRSQNVGHNWGTFTFHDFSSSHVWVWEMDYKESRVPKNCAGEDSWEYLTLQGDQTSQSEMKSALNIHWKHWCWSWSSNTLATWCEELNHWKRSWCWESLRTGREGDNRGWDGWMASLTWWTWIWASSGNWW